MKLAGLMCCLLVCGVAEAISMPAHLAGAVHNLQTGNDAQVVATVVHEGGDRYRAMGSLDNITLFGRFNVAGHRADCGKARASLCLDFDGQMELGDDDSGFPELTRTGFSFRLEFDGDQVNGGYRIAPIPPYQLTEQPGELRLHLTSDDVLARQFDERVSQHPDQPKYLWDRAIASALLEAYARAERDYRRYAELAPQDPRGYAKVGRMLLMQKKLDEARGWIDRAIALDLGKSLWLVQRGHLALLAGNERQALADYRQALRLMTSRRAFDESLAHDLKLFMARGWQSGSAGIAYAMAVEMFPKVAALPLTQADEASFQGRYAESIPLYSQALAVAEHDLSQSHPMVGRILSRLANNQTLVGEFRPALDNYSRSLTILRADTAASEQDIILTQLAQADLYEQLGQPGESEKLRRAALEQARASRTLRPYDVSTIAVGLAMFQFRNGKLAEALDTYQQELPLLVRVLGPTHHEMANHYNDIALINSYADNHQQALEFYRKSLEISLAYYGEEHPNNAMLLGNIGQAYLKLADYPHAEQAMLRALNLAVLLQQPDVIIYANSSMGELRRAQGRTAEAILFGKQVVNELQRLRRQNAELDKTLRQSFTRRNESHYRGVADMLIAEGRLPEAQQVLAMLKEDEYYEFIRRDAASGGLETTVPYNSEEQRWTQRYDEIGARVAALGAELRELQQKEPAQRSDAERERIKTLRADLSAAMKHFNQTVQALQETFAKLKSERYAELSRKQIDMDQRGLVRDLGHGAVLLQYIAMDDALHILLTTPDVVLARKVPVGAAELNRQVQQFRTALGNPRADPRPAGRSLYDLLIAPVQADLAQAGAKMLMVSLDGALRYVPLAALYDGRQYLAENYALALYTEAARDRVKDQPRAGGWQVAALGLSRKVEGFNPLPAVVGELHGIVRDKGDPGGVVSGGVVPGGVVPGVIYLDADFTNDRLMEVLFDQYRVLHIASHFVFTAGTLEKSYLLLGDG
ncbi:MAG: tetratricopeptide repeat protein, partial [Gallionella sp.]|nr:tetratricopeptide repeat protein [Gallionella sp.]